MMESGRYTLSDWDSQTRYATQICEWSATVHGFPWILCHLFFKQHWEKAKRVRKCSIAAVCALFDCTYLPLTWTPSRMLPFEKPKAGAFGLGVCLEAPTTLPSLLPICLILLLSCLPFVPSIFYNQHFLMRQYLSAYSLGGLSI